MQFVKRNYLLLLILISGLALRLYNFTAISLWHDEAFSVLLIRYPWREMIYRIGLDVHPPMYYIFLRLWHYGFGDSLASLRGFSVLFGILTIAAAYIFVKTAFNNERAALIAAALIALNPFQIQYVTEARMYTMGAFFAIAAAWALIKALRAQNEYYAGTSGTKRFLLIYYFLFIASTSIIIYTHYYLLFVAVALGLYGFIFQIRLYKTDYKKYGWLVGSVALIGLLFLPWLRTFLFQFRQVGAGYWIPPMDR